MPAPVTAAGPQPGFDWEEEDPMASGFEDEEAEPTPPPPPPKPLPGKAGKPMKPAPKVNAAVAQTLNELEESPDPAELSEAEWRLEKAGFYRNVMNSQLLSSDHPAAIEVERELQEWAQGRLEQLLGIKPTTEPKNQAIQAPVELPFSPDEVDVLKALASKALARAAGQAMPPPVQSLPAAPAKPKPVITPVAIPPKPAAITPVAVAEGKRGRGRPRKPCRICGELACEHKRVPAPAQAQTAPGAQPRPQQPQGPVSGEMYDGVPIQLMPDGTKYIDAPNGRRYKLEVRTVTHKETGEQRQAYMPIELSKPPDPQAKPFPSDQEAMMMAAAEATKNLQAVQGITAVSAVSGQKITGATLIKAAMEAPEREEYVPTPPQGKR